MPPTKTREKIQNDILQVIYILEPICNNKNASRIERDSAKTTIDCLKNSLNKSSQEMYKAHKDEENWRNFDILLNNIKKDCKKFESKRVKNKIDPDLYNYYKKIDEIFNQYPSSNLKQASDAIRDTANKLNDFLQMTNGEKYLEILQRNGLERMDLLKLLKDKYFPNYEIADIEFDVNNILYGKIKNPNGPLWEEMLECLPELCHENADNKKNFFGNQWALLIIDILDSFGHIEVPKINLDSLE